MADARQVLAVGPRALAEAIAAACPECHVEPCSSPLEAVWESASRPFDAVFISLSATPSVDRLITSLRRASPAARLVLVCPPRDEPDARRGVQTGADDYVLEPVVPDDLRRLLDLPRPEPTSARSPTWNGPRPAELAALGDILGGLEAGPQTTLERVALLLCDTFQAAGLRIELDELVAETGRMDEPQIAEVILRGGQPVGRIVVARGGQNTYLPAVATWLAAFARLVEAAVGIARRHAQLGRVASCDELTGLAERRTAERRLDELVARAMQRREPLTLILLEVDDFEQYRDLYGPRAGDELLCELAALLSAVTRREDVLARTGAAEFLIAIADLGPPRVPGSKHPAEAGAFARRIEERIACGSFRRLGPDAPGPVTMTAALANVPWDAHTREALMRIAGEALVNARQRGEARLRLAGRLSADAVRPPPS
jgi:diguanylate cyclase (GGDEF)-like protein